MPNKKVNLHPIHELFKFDAQIKESKCLVNGCKVSIKGKNSSHLKRHAKGKHPLEYDAYLMTANKETEVQPRNSPKMSQEGMKLRSHDQAAKQKSGTKMELKKKQNQINCKGYKKRTKLKKETEDKLKKPSIYESTSLIEEPTAPLLPITNVEVLFHNITKNLFTPSKENTSTSRPAPIHPTTSQSDPVPVTSTKRGTRIVEIEENHHVPISKVEAMSLSINNKLQGQQLNCVDPNPSFPDTRHKPLCPKTPTLGIVDEHPILNALQFNSPVSPVSFATNPQEQQPNALFYEQSQTAVSSKQLENIGISDLVDNLSGGTINKENFNFANTPQPSVSNIPTESIEDVPLLVPIDESFQKASFPTDYDSIEMFLQPCPSTTPIEDYYLQSSTQIVLSPEAQIMLSEQMRKHVQLLTQMHLITAQQSDLKLVTESCHCMLQNLVPLKQRLEIVNLDEALDLITHWEAIVTKASPEELRKYQRPVVNCGEKKKFLKRSRKNLERFPFNPKMVELMAESRVFIYPELLPKLAIFQAEQGPCKMSPHEDQLIAMGIERFTPFYVDYFAGSKEPIAHLICSMISQFMLPHWTAKQIETRIITKCLPTSPANPIKYYLENKVAPSVYHVIQPFDRYSTQKLADIPPFLLPERWRELFGYLSRGSTVVTSHYQFPEQNVNRDASNSSSCETNIGETALTNSEIDQKRLATSTSKQLKSPNKRHTIFVNTQTSITNATHQRRMKSVTKRRRVVDRHKVEIDLEEIFIENIKPEIDKWENF